jgi:hypothetical protein
MRWIQFGRQCLPFLNPTGCWTVVLMFSAAACCTESSLGLFWLGATSCSAAYFVLSTIGEIFFSLETLLGLSQGLQKGKLTHLQIKELHRTKVYNQLLQQRFKFFVKLATLQGINQLFLPGLAEGKPVKGQDL